MMLRSSSTPVLGSLLQSFSESPNHQPELHKHTAKISCSSTSSNGGFHDFKKSLFHPSPSLSENNGSGGAFRRAQSDGNLEGLMGDADEFNPAKKSSRRNSLETILSYSTHNLWTSFEDDDDDYEGIEEEEEEEEEEGEDKFDYNPMRMENMMGFEKMGSMKGNNNNNNNNNNNSGSLGWQGEGKMYLASGIGASGVDFAGRGGGGGSYRPVSIDNKGGDGGGERMEEHYKGMLMENPGNPLYLRNYAEFLYKIKGDCEAAEEYYARAILADQEDGESLSQYGKIIWELHHDKDRAANYFERAIVASSQSSHIHAAYANFLWEAEEEDEDEEEEGSRGSSHTFLHQGSSSMASAMA